MFRIALFVAGCVAGYVASGYFDGLLGDAKESSPSPSQKDTEATA